MHEKSTDCRCRKKKAHCKQRLQVYTSRRQKRNEVFTFTSASLLSKLPTGSIELLEVMTIEIGHSHRLELGAFKGTNATTSSTHGFITELFTLHGRCVQGLLATRRTKILENYLTGTQALDKTSLKMHEERTDVSLRPTGCAVVRSTDFPVHVPRPGTQRCNKLEVP